MSMNTNTSSATTKGGNNIEKENQKKKKNVMMMMMMTMTMMIKGAEERERTATSWGDCALLWWGPRVSSYVWGRPFLKGKKRKLTSTPSPSTPISIRTSWYYCGCSWTRSQDRFSWSFLALVFTIHTDLKQEGNDLGIASCIDSRESVKNDFWLVKRWRRSLCASVLCSGSIDLCNDSLPWQCLVRYWSYQFVTPSVQYSS